MIGFVREVVRRARQERLTQIAGSLAFTTLLSLVPLVTVSFALLTRLAVFHRLKVALQEHVLQGLLPQGIGLGVLRALDGFAANARGLSLLGLALLLATSVALLMTVENVLNQIWGVRRPRPLARRVGLYLAVLAIGPPLAAVVVWGVSALVGESMGLLQRGPSWVHLALQAGPLVAPVIGLTALFRFVPNTEVRWPSALLGGLLGGLGLEGAKRVFGAYLVQMPTYHAVYGAFAIVPLFLVWVYVSWLVTLGAALIAASLGGAAAPAARKPKRSPSPRRG